MRILFFASTYPHPSYPFSAFIKVLCEEMVVQGHEIIVVAPQSYSSILIKDAKRLPVDTTYTFQSESGIKKEIRVLRPYFISFGHGKFRRLTWIANRLAAELIVKRKRLLVDVLYAHFWNNAYNALYLAKRMCKPLFVATGEDHIIAGKVLPPKVKKQMTNTVQGVICVSAKNKNESILAGLTYESKCIILPNAANPSLFHVKDKNTCRKELGFPLDAFIVVFCGRFNKRKGANRVSDAIKKMSDGNIKSIFIGSSIGSGIVMPDCEGILFKGTLNHNEMATYLNCADVFVLPSLAEGCSNSIVEAMACGLPIISSDLPFNYDILDENNAVLVDPNNVEQIADAINLLKNNEELRVKLAEGALAIANTKGLTIDKRAARIVAFIEEKLKG